MGTVSLVLQVVLWTLGLALGAAAVGLGYLAHRSGRRHLTLPAVCFGLLALGFISIAVAIAVNGLRPPVFFVAAALISWGTLGSLLATEYAPLRQIRIYSAAVAVLGVVGLLWAIVPLFQRDEVSAGIPRPDQLAERAVVTRVIDGDTIVVTLDGREFRVRYIGVDAPETVHPALPVQCYGKQASEFNRRLVAGKSVRLERDVS